MTNPVTGAPEPLEIQLTMELSPADLPQVALSRNCPVCAAPAPVDTVFCETCGMQLTNDRDHYSEQVGRRLAAVSDRGVRHPHNEDASAIDGDESTGFGILVVCDGVSSARDSALASLVGARAARDELRSLRPVGGVETVDGEDTDEARRTTLVETMGRAVRSAHEAVLAQTAAETKAAATFAAAAIDGDLIGWGALGDSRIYWLPDPATADRARLLSRDDSMVELQIAAGVPRVQAEHGPHAHTITGWIGHHAPELRPELAVFVPPAPGWLLICTDGLWNYAPEPEEMRHLVDRLADRLADRVSDELRPSALALADALTRWACEAGGRDNVTVALAGFPLS